MTEQNGVYNLEDKESWISKVRAGERILISGKVYTARDAVHKKWKALMNSGMPLPIPPSEMVIYYAGPTPTPDGMAIGSCGPTTSSRMDIYYDMLAKKGLKITIGKGDRSPQVAEAIKETGGVYLCAIGGAGALCAKHIVSSRVIAYEELGCESMKELTLCDFPVYVGIDSQGNSIFDGAKK